MNEDKATRYHRLGRRAGILSHGLDGRHPSRPSADRARRRACATGRRVLSGANPDAHRRAVRPLAVARVRCRDAAVQLLSRVPARAALWPLDRDDAALAEGSREGGAHRRAVRRSWARCSCTSRFGTGRRSGGRSRACGYSLVAIVLVNLAPVVLLPLFFTFKPLEKARCAIA